MANEEEVAFDLSVQAIFDERNLIVNDREVYMPIKKMFEAFIKNVVSLGINFQRQSHSKKLTVENVNDALVAYNYNPILGYRNRKGIKYVSVGLVDGQEVYIPEDKQIDLNTFINKPLPPTPIEKFFSFHWQACLKGVQPQIPENIAYVFLWFLACFILK